MQVDWWDCHDPSEILSGDQLTTEMLNAAKLQPAACRWFTHLQIHMISICGASPHHDSLQTNGQETTPTSEQHPPPRSDLPVDLRSRAGLQICADLPRTCGYSAYVVRTCIRMLPVCQIALLAGTR